VLGLAFAILIDQKIRAESAFRSIFLYPMALSLIVTGTAWKWLLDPGVGLEHTLRDLGWETSASAGSRTATWRSTASSSPRSGRPPAS
jgi:glucose/mannose transport system permease protein